MLFTTTGSWYLGSITYLGCLALFLQHMQYTIKIMMITKLYIFLYLRIIIAGIAIPTINPIETPFVEFID